MTQERLNYVYVCVLNIHSEFLDSLDILGVAEQFVAKNDARLQRFGKIVRSK